LLHVGGGATQHYQRFQQVQRCGISNEENFELISPSISACSLACVKAPFRISEKHVKLPHHQPASHSALLRNTSTSIIMRNFGYRKGRGIFALLSFLGFSCFLNAGASLFLDDPYKVFSGYTGHSSQELSGCMLFWFRSKIKSQIM
jgi:hypothetical protein